MTFPNCLSKRCLNDFQNYKYTLRWCSMWKTHKYAHLNLQFAHGIFIIKLCHELTLPFPVFPLFSYLWIFLEGACWRRPRSQKYYRSKCSPAECYALPKNNFDRLNKKNAINNMFFPFFFYLLFESLTLLSLECVLLFRLSLSFALFSSSSLFFLFIFFFSPFLLWSRM